MLFGALLLVGVTVFASDNSTNGADLANAVDTAAAGGGSKVEPVAPAASDAPAGPGKIALLLSAVKTNTVDKVVALTAAYPKTSLAIGGILIAVSSFVAGYKIRANMANADDEKDITEITFLESDAEDAEDYEDDAEQA